MYSTEEINSIVATIHEQLKATTPIAVRWSWGISKQQATLYEDKPTLALRVSGALHKGGFSFPMIEPPTSTTLVSYR
ncbi:MAG: hypothetical protein J6Q01_06235 [Alistipes sp.]|nr:hypothetical protein [Alistipes sp.]